MTRHGDPQYAEFCDDDLDIALVNADMTTWLAANPCLARTDEEEEICFGSDACRCSK